MATTTHNVFHLSSELDEQSPDLVITSANQVAFHVHRHRLLAASTNHFDTLLSLPSKTAIEFSESSPLISIMLNTIYDKPLDSLHPNATILISSIDTLKKYGIPLNQYVHSNTPLFTALVAAAPSCAIDLYILAAENDLHELAAAISVYLYSFDLSTVTDEMAIRMGPIYLKKLFLLQITRIATLEQLIAAPLALHSPTSTCDMDAQHLLARRWDLATINIQTIATASMTSASIGGVLGTVEAQTECRFCRDAVQVRVQEVVSGWEQVQKTM
ncbi:unnamed protein product [Somion occarium]|uniref:BTB domain-containing protein n=1 Tax=Somion occarium TaxID=3059160 RepID=A0ABP1E2A3_9APHY